MPEIWKCPHMPIDVTDRVVGRAGDRLVDHAGLGALHPIDLSGLFVGGRLRWMMPMPPWRAMAMAIRASVTVSMARETRGSLTGCPA